MSKSTKSESRKVSLIIMFIKSTYFLVTVIVIFTLFVGFFVGKAVNAAGDAPGTQGDPIAAQSYVDAKINQLLARIAKLEGEVAQLKNNNSQSQAVNPAPAQTEKKGVVSGDPVNVRAGAGTNNNIITVVNKGTVVAVLGNQDGWYKVRFSNGTSGWIAGWLLAVK